MTECIKPQHDIVSSIKEKNRGQLIVFSAPSGCGKDTVLKHLLKKNDNIYLSVSATTRSPRINEEDGKDYFFIAKEAFEASIKEDRMLEWAEYCQEYYGTPKEIVDYYRSQGKDVVLEIEVKGALMIKHKVPDAVFIFLMPPSVEELRNRLVNRGTEPADKIEKRLAKGLEEMEQVSEYTYVVFNNDAKNAADEIDAIITSEKCKYIYNIDTIEKVMKNA